MAADSDSEDGYYDCSEPDEPVGDELAASQEKDMSEGSAEDYQRYADLFEKWRGEQRITSRLVAHYIRVYRKGTEHYPDETHGKEIPPHMASSTRTMFSYLHKFLENHKGIVLSKHTKRQCYRYISEKEKKESLKQAPVLSDEEIQKILELDETTVTVLRNKLIFIIGTTVLARAEELWRLRVEDITFEKDGFVVNLRKCKTKKSSETQARFVPSIFCDYPVKDKLREYLTHIPDRGALWRSIPLHSTPRTTKPLRKNGIYDAIKQLTKGKSFDRVFTSHSMRRTGTTRMANAGCNERQITTMGNWASTSVAERYIDRSKITLRACANAIATSTISKPQTTQEEKPTPEAQSETLEAKTTSTPALTVASSTTQKTIVISTQTSDLSCPEAEAESESSVVEPQTKRSRVSRFVFNGPIHNVIVVERLEDAQKYCKSDTSSTGMW